MLDRHRIEADVTAESNQDVSVLVRFEEGKTQPWSMSGLAKGIKNQVVVGQDRHGARAGGCDAAEEGQHAVATAHARLTRAERPARQARSPRSKSCRTTLVLRIALRTIYLDVNLVLHA